MKDQKAETTVGSSTSLTERSRPESVRTRIEILIRLAAELSMQLEAIQLATALTNRCHIAQGINFYDEVRDFEVRLIRYAMGYAGGSQWKAADLLNLARSTLSYKIKTYKIYSPRGRRNFHDSINGSSQS